jgi:hypothetical protein
MFEKPQKAQVVRIKIEAVSLDSTSMAPSPDGPLLADCCLATADRRYRPTPASRALVKRTFTDSLNALEQTFTQRC